MAKNKHEKKVEKTVAWAEKQAEAVKIPKPGPNPPGEPAPMTHEVSNHPPATFTNKVGRPTKYEYEKTNRQVKMLASKGFTDIEMGEALDISESCFHEWKKEHPKFMESITEGKALVDDMVVKSLFNRAMGCSIKETKVFCSEGTIVTEEVDKNFPPDPTSMIFWLKNRRPKEWRDKHDIDFTSPFTVQMSEADQKTL
jgi:hypothetical protein